MLDILNLISLIGAVQGIFFGLILLSLPSGNRKAKRFLALFLLVYSVGMFGAALYTSRWILKVPQLGLLHTPFAAMISPFFLLYILAMTQKNFRFRGWYAVFFLPFFLIVIWYIPFFSLSAAEKRNLLELSYSGFPTSWKSAFAFSAVTDFVFLIASYLIILRHERVIREVYSSPLNKTMLWTRHFLYAGMATFLLCVLVSFINIAWADPISNLLFSLIIYIFGYRALRQPEIFTDVLPDSLPELETLPLIHQTEKYEKSGMMESKANALLAKLENLMITEKLFLNPTLNLQELAGYVQITPHQLSQLLNQFRGVNFSDFVNGYRVDYFKEAVIDPGKAHFSLLALAFESGFNSKAAFNAVFKKTTGHTPSEFKEHIEASQGFKT